MSKFKSLDDVIGYLTNVAEFELRHTEHIKIPDGHMTVISENYNIMFDAIQWITEKLEQPQLNENQKIVLEYLKTNFGKYDMFVKSIFYPIQELVSEYWVSEVNTAFEQLDLKQEVQVLQAFIQWTLEQEEE